MLGFCCSTGCFLVVASRLLSSYSAHGISLWWLLLLWSMGSRACRLQQLRLLGSRAQAQ